MRNLTVLTLLITFLISLACARQAEQASTTAANIPTPTPAVTPTPTPPEDAPRISLADAKKAFDDGGALFVDARAAEAYKLEHIKGAINITSATLDARLKDLPPNKKIIVYCS